MKHSQNFFYRIKTVPAASLYIASILMLAAAVVAALCLGAAKYSPLELLENGDILLYIRVPRVIAAVFAGAGLAGGGVIVQTLLGKSLAGPNIIGINSGAGFMVLVASAIFPLLPQMQPLAAFIGALFSVMLVYSMARRVNASKMTILLTGVILNSLFNALSEVLCTFFPDVSIGYTGFRVGGLSAVQPSVLFPAACLIAVAIAVVMFKADTLELLSLGDETAFTLGIPVKKCRLLFLICAASMTGAAVSFAGLIGFLGLIVPHAARLVVGEEIRKLFPLSVLWGALLMLVCDTVARTAFAPFELSVGIVLSIIGAPVFIRILLKRKKR